MIKAIKVASSPPPSGPSKAASASTIVSTTAMTEAKPKAIAPAPRMIGSLARLT